MNEAVIERRPDIVQSGDGTSVYTEPGIATCSACGHRFDFEPFFATITCTECGTVYEKLHYRDHVLWEVPE